MRPHLRFVIASRTCALTVVVLATATCFPRPAISQMHTGTDAYPVSAGPSDIDRPARAHAKGASFRGGVSDALLHVDPGYVFDGLPDILAAEKVRRAIVMPVPNEGLGNRVADGTVQKIHIAQAFKKQVKVMCGGDYLSNWLSDSEKYGVVETTARERLRRLADDLDSGWCLGVGELGLLHFNKRGDQNVIQVRFDSALMLQVVDAVGKRGAWIQLHVESREPNGRPRDKDMWGALSLWSQRQPKLKIMLSHTGMTTAANARKLLETFPNVYMSIKLMTSKMSAWSHLEPLLNADGALYEDWATLMEDMPDRFVIGSDAKFGQAGHESEGEESYGKMILRYRRMLGSLSADAARRIAMDNVKKLYGFGKEATEADETDVTLK